MWTAVRTPSGSATPWSPCDKACDGGTRRREVFCLSSNLTLLPNELCPPPLMHTEEACNTFPCHTYVWGVGTWGDCSMACGGERYPHQTRDVL
eukprot:jgi/Botrbrau1/21227/Bobra.39_2s0026.1